MNLLNYMDTLPVYHGQVPRVFTLPAEASERERGAEAMCNYCGGPTTRGACIMGLYHVIEIPLGRFISFTL